jgi:glycerol-3-phosphate cytidylyltransferase
MKKVITFGTFDVFHVGHVNVLERAKAFGSRLIVGISSDHLNYKKKNRNPIFCEKQRMKIISSLHCVDQVFLEESLELKGDYIKKYEADVLIMGDDWKGKFDHFEDLCEVIYLPRTEGVSTTEIISGILDYFGEPKKA